jgi:hypothetical protein
MNALSRLRWTSGPGRVVAICAARLRYGRCASAQAPTAPDRQRNTLNRMAKSGRRSTAVVGGKEFGRITGVGCRNRKLLDQPQRRGTQVYDGRRTESGGEVTDRAVLRRIACGFVFGGYRLSGRLGVAAFANGGVGLAGGTTFTGEPHRAALMPGHNDVEPERLEDKQRDPKGPRVHDRQPIRRPVRLQLRVGWPVLCFCLVGVVWSTKRMAMTSDRTARAALASWVALVGGALVAASVWIYRRFAGEPKVLTRAQEKQRRKALIRDAK